MTLSEAAVVKGFHSGKSRVQTPSGAQSGKRFPRSTRVDELEVHCYVLVHLAEALSPAWETLRPARDWDVGPSVEDSKRARFGRRSTWVTDSND